MTRSLRLAIFFAGAVGFAILALRIASHTPGVFGVRDRYAHAINTQVIGLRNVTDAVTAVNFDFRGFDTLGEEFILFVSVMGAVVLLREEKAKEQELPDAIDESRDVRGNRRAARLDPRDGRAQAAVRALHRRPWAAIAGRRGFRAV